MAVRERRFTTPYSKVEAIIHARSGFRNDGRRGSRAARALLLDAGRLVLGKILLHQQVVAVIELEIREHVHDEGAVGAARHLDDLARVRGADVFVEVQVTQRGVVHDIHLALDARALARVVEQVRREVGGADDERVGDNRSKLADVGAARK